MDAAVPETEPAPWRRSALAGRPARGQFVQEFANDCVPRPGRRESGVWAVLQTEQWWPRPPLPLAELQSNMPHSVDLLDAETVAMFTVMANLATSVVQSRAWAHAHEATTIGCGPHALLCHEGGPIMIVADALAFAQASLTMPPWPMITVMLTLSQVADEAHLRLTNLSDQIDPGNCPADENSEVRRRLRRDCNIAALAEQWAVKCLATLKDWDSSSVQLEDFEMH